MNLPAATLSTLGAVPVASVALNLCIHRLKSARFAPANMIGNAVATPVVAKWEGAQDEKSMCRVLNADAGKATMAAAT